MNHYETLGIDKNSTADQIKSAYKKLAVQHHPDKGGDEEKFKEISNAYGVLGDEEKRNEYNQAGDNNHRQQHHDPFAGGNPFGGGFPFGGMGGFE